MDKHLGGAFSGLLSMLVGIAFSGSAPASDVVVRVFDAHASRPLSGAAVCLGTGASPGQFGAYTTGLDGTVRFSGVPVAPVLLTVSKPQYRGARQALPVATRGRQVSIALAAGGGGPSCVSRERDQMAAAPKHLMVKGLRLRLESGGNVPPAIVLEPRVAGDPTHFRVAETRDLRDVDWQDFHSPVRLSVGEAKGRRTFYYQIGRLHGTDRARLQTESNVARASIWVP